MGSSYLAELNDAIRCRHADKTAIRRHLIRVTGALESRIKSPDNSSNEFVKAAVAVVRKLDPNVYPEIAFQCFASAVPYLYAQGSLSSALLAAKGMSSCGHYTGRKNLIRKAENYLGVIHKTLGNISDAVLHLQRALQLAEELGDRPGQTGTLNNLGSTFVEVGLYREALPCFERAISLSGSDPECLEDKSTSLYNMSQLFLRIGDLKSAHDAILESFRISQEPRSVHDVHSRTLREANFVYLALELGRHGEATQHTRVCQEYAAKSGTRPSLFLAKLATGLCDVRLGAADKGLTLLQAALVESEQLERVEFRADALAALTSAYENLHRPNDALRCLRSLMQHIVAMRELAIDVLLSSDRESPLRPADGPEFFALKYREAKLEAACAQLSAREERIDLLQRLAMAATLKDDPSGLHGYRVGKLSCLLAAEIGWPADRCHILETTARLHDIGKVGIPDHILLSSSALKQTERDFMQSHTVIGASLLCKGADPELTMAAEIAQFHHEHWNGAGYPTGVAHERIPIHARIVALADVFDALTHGRPYAAAWSKAKALQQIHALAGNQFDPELTRRFISMVEALEKLHPDLDEFLGAAANASPFVLARKNIEATILKGQQHLGAYA